MFCNGFVRNTGTMFEPCFVTDLGGKMYRCSNTNCLLRQVHDYVKNYLGEGKKAREFAKQFLEKRSHYKNKARNEKRQEEVRIH